MTNEEEFSCPLPAQMDAGRRRMWAAFRDEIAGLLTC